MRIILTVGCVGKTYTDKHYNNVYDWDKHTLDYKYDKTGFENLSNEEFKSIPNRKIKDGWFEKYMEDWCNLIDSNEYEIVTGWLQEDCVNYLLNKGYNIEIVLVNCSKEDENIYKERSVSRGNNAQYWTNLRKYYDSTLVEYLNQFRNNKQVKIWTLTQPIYLSDFLVFTGSKLIVDSLFGNQNLKNYVVKIYDNISSSFDNKLNHEQVLKYTSLVLNTIEVSNQLNNYLPITNRQVHDMWTLAESKYKPYHQSCIPFNNLTKEVKDLDTYYTDKLNSIAKNLFKNLKGIYLNNKEWYF
jgi:hypothetical protein